MLPGTPAEGREVLAERVIEAVGGVPVDIGTGIIRLGRSSYVLGQGIFSGDKCIATAEVVTVYFDAATNKSRPLPDELRGVLENNLIGVA